MLLIPDGVPAAAVAGPATPSFIISRSVLSPDAGSASVELIATNAEVTARRIDVPDRIVAKLRLADGTDQPVNLERVSESPAAVVLAPSGFTRLHYRLALPPGTAGAPLLILPGAPAVALVVPERNAAPVRQAETETSRSASPPVVTTGLAEARGRSGFLANLTSYQPIYAVYGPGTNSDARIQVSLKYQFFGTPGVRGSWLDGFTFGFTQRLFWNLGPKSSPFRNVDYVPELFYAVPARPVGDWTLGGRAGVRHQSNGRSGDASRSFNMIYLEPEAATTWRGLDLAFGPRAWIYVGRRSDNPDIAHYYGNAGLYARAGTDDGLQVDLTGRLNPGSGKGALDALLSYPLTGLWAAGPKLYLFAQGFAGYGETSLDYNRRQTRLRAGIGFTR